MAEEAGVVVQLGAAESVAGCEQWVSVRCELTVSDGRRRATCGGLIRAEGGRDATVETGADEAACFPLDATTGRIAPAACPPSCENERSRRRCSCGWRLKISEGALETGALWLVPLPSLWLCCSSWLLLLDGESGSDREPISFICRWSVSLSRGVEMERKKSSAGAVRGWRRWLPLPPSALAPTQHQAESVSLRL